VADDHVHIGRFADETSQRFDRPFGQAFQCDTHADTTDFLVIGKHQMQRFRQRGRKHGIDTRKHAGDKAFHVRRTATVQALSDNVARERIDRPVLTLDRHDIGVPGQDISRHIDGADGRHKIGLRLGLVGIPHRGNAAGGQKILNPFDNGQVGAA